MQEPVAIQVSTVNGNGLDLHGPASSPSSETHSAGFTAVNGIKPKSALFRPSEPAHLAVTSPNAETTVRAAAGVTPYQTAGWRPDDSATVLQQSPDSPSVTGKRKRSGPIDLAVEDPSRRASGQEDEEVSPSRRLPTLDSAIDLTSPEYRQTTCTPFSPDSDFSDQDHSSNQRAKSPVERWNKGEPPPKPRPETEASLAASLQQFQQQSRQVQESHHSYSISPHNGSPPNERDDMASYHHPSDDQYHTGDYLDPKRRKRNFSNRTKTGCHTCRKRKKKCDEGKPTCLNCERGNFACEGYGPKPPGFKTTNPTRSMPPLQSKTPMGPYSGRQSDGPAARTEEGRSYSHWGRVPPPPPTAPPPSTLPPTPAEPEHQRQFVPVAPADPTRRPSTADNWQKPAYTSHEPPPPPPPYPNERLPPPNFPPIPASQPPHHHDRRNSQSVHSYQHPPPPPLPQHPQSILLQQPPSSRHAHPPHPPPVPHESWGPPPNFTPYQGHSGLPNPMTARESSTAPSISHRAPSAFALGYANGSNPFAEKDKMLRGQPYLHYLDPVLLQDKRECKAALERYNKTAEILTSGISQGERGKLFDQILQPHKRPDAKAREYAHTAPVGSVGDHSLIESPFKCEFGYNIHIGKDCVVESGCYFQDAADIYLGHRVIMGHNVKLYCVTAGLDPSARKGAHGCVNAGAIKIDDDCFIGGDVIVMPFVTIGRGAVVGAGSVVTKDVEEHTVVAGNPAKLIRRIEGSNVGRHYSQQIQRQQDKMVNWMVGYANSGFSWYQSEF